MASHSVRLARAFALATLFSCRQRCRRSSYSGRQSIERSTAISAWAGEPPGPTASVLDDWGDELSGRAAAGLGAMSACVGSAGVMWAGGSEKAVKSEDWGRDEKKGQASVLSDV